MINREAIRAHIRAYAEAQTKHLRDTMEYKLMELLDKQTEFERLHQEFIAATIHQLRNKENTK
jgi:hypothetical protein